MMESEALIQQQILRLVSVVLIKNNR